MTKLERLEEEIEEKRKGAFAESAYGSPLSRKLYEAQANAYELVLMLITRLKKPICQKCGGTVEDNHGSPKCLNCGAEHDSEGNLIPTIDGKYVKPSNARASKG